MMSTVLRTLHITVAVTYLRARDLENPSQERRDANLLGTANSLNQRRIIRRCLHRNISGGLRPALTSELIGQRISLSHQSGMMDLSLVMASVEEHDIPDDLTPRWIAHAKLHHQGLTDRTSISTLNPEPPTSV
jgi:hypothetical protein